MLTLYGLRIINGIDGTRPCEVAWIESMLQRSGGEHCCVHSPGCLGELNCLEDGGEACPS